MSADISAAPLAEQAAAIDASRNPRRSYRRKYRKIMVKFEDRMRESDGLFKDEQRICDISQRLAEQTDQLLSMLVELNSDPHIPARLRYDLRPASAPRKAQQSGKHQDEQSVHELLRTERNQIQKGESTLQNYQDLQKELLDTTEFAPKRSYASLVKNNKVASTTQDKPVEASSPSHIGSLSIKQEELYLQSLDDFTTGKSAVPRGHAANSLGGRTAERTTEQERQMQLKNPVSVYNWLRKHQPQVFLQDHETTGDKGGKSAGSRSSKRTAAKESKNDTELYDEDGIAAEYAASSRGGKRKRNDDDGPFRPKGGKSGQPPKRRKEDSGGKRSKRSSMDARFQ